MSVRSSISSTLTNHLFRCLSIVFMCFLSTISVDLKAQDSISFQVDSLILELQECLSTDQECPVQEQWFVDGKAALPSGEYIRFIYKISECYYRQSRFETASDLIGKAQLEAIAIGDSSLLAEGDRRISLLLFYQGDYQEALHMTDKLLGFYRRQQDTFRIAKGTLYRGQILKQLGNYTASLENYLQALDLFKALEDTANIADALGELSTLYAMSNENKKAIEYGFEAATIFKSLPGHEGDYAYVSLNLANNLSYDGFPDSAITILKEVIPIFQAENNRYLHMNAVAQLGRAYHEKGDHQKAIEILEQSNALDPEMNFIFQAIYNQHLMGRIYLEMEEPENALIYFKQSYRLHQEVGMNDETQPLMLDLANTYEYIGQSDSALKYYKAFQVVADSLYSVEKQNKLNELKAEYEAELREEQLRNQEREIELLEKSNEAKTQRNITLGVILLVVFLLAITIIQRQRHAIRMNKLLSEEKQKALEAEMQAQEAERLQLEEDLKHRKRELANQALLIAEKNELMRSFRSDLENVDSDESDTFRSLRSISRKMERAENQQGDWDKFMRLFKDVHPELWTKLVETHLDLTHNELRLLALMRMGFTNKEIANILHITEGGLKKARYRLRKKMQLDAQSNLHQYIQQF